MKMTKRMLFNGMLMMLLLSSTLFSADSTWKYVGLGNTLPNEMVNKIVVNSKGDVIFANGAVGMGYLSGGVTVFNGKDWNYFYTSTTGHTDTTDFPSNDVTTICLDSKDNIYASFGKSMSTTIRIAYYNGNKWIPIDVKGYDSLISSFRPMAISREGILWTGFEREKSHAYYNIGYFDGKWNLISLDSINPKHKVVSDLFFDSNDNLWMSIGSVGLFKREKNGKWISIDPTNGIFTPYVTKITEDKQKNIWLATGAGLYKYDGNKWEWFNKSNSGLPDSIDCTIQFDNKNNAWIGTADSGLVRFDGIFFKKYFYKSWKYIFYNHYISDVTIDSSGNIWTIVGSFNGSYMLDAKYIETSVEDINIFNTLYISPNPVSNFLYLKTNKEFGKIEIYSSLGLKVLETDFKEKIDVSSLSSGIYFLKINNGNTFEIKKFIIKK